MLNIISSAFEYCAMILLSLALFRLPIRYHIVRIAFIGIVLSVVYYYFAYTIKLEQFPILTTIIAIYTILIAMLLNLPILYSLLVCFIGYLSGMVVEILVILLAIQMGFTTVELANQSILHASIMKLVVSVLLFLLTYWLLRRKLGFMFIVNRLTLRDSLKGYNFYISVLILIGVVFMQFVSQSFSLTSGHSYFLSGLILLMILTIVLSYRQNKMLIKEKYERLGRNKNEHH